MSLFYFIRSAKFSFFSPNQVLEPKQSGEILRICAEARRGESLLRIGTGFLRTTQHSQEYILRVSSRFSWHLGFNVPKRHRLRSGGLWINFDCLALTFTDAAITRVPSASIEVQPESNPHPRARQSGTLTSELPRRGEYSCVGILGTIGHPLGCCFQMFRTSAYY